MIPEIANKLLLRLCSLRYLPAETLSETALAEEFGVSRTPIRQVLQQLALFGLVETRNGIGTVVTEVHKERVFEIFRIRKHMALLMDEMVDPSQFPKAGQRIEVLREIALAQLTKRDIQEYATIGLRIQKIILDTIVAPEYRRLWEECYYRSCRVSYGVVESDWDAANRLQLEEIDALRKIFGNRDPRALARFCHDAIAEWMSLARRVDGQRVSGDASFDALLREYTPGP